MKCLQHTRLIIFAVLLCMIIILSGFLFLGRCCPRVLAAKDVGKPIIIRDIIRNNYLGINQIISEADRIYIMHANYGVVTVYDSAGIYQYTVSVYSHENGRTKIALLDGLLHIQDKQGNVYRFQDDALHDFIPKNHASVLQQNIDFDTQSNTYFLKGASIYKTLGNGVAECVISRPAWLVFTQPEVTRTLLFMLMLACFICLKLPLKKS